ncbi:pyruvate kinase [Spiroplasma endosymbiont of Aspidapion aeneum]|uniref:pyruvate kinase n=1 Tax=Spiroplasma endosymbiont of Aspidapion aeneum TaxID=3066276 RepID=UPI00313D68C9
MKHYDLSKMHKRTKLITTVGPSCHSKEKILELFENGMTTVRLNFSHANFVEHGERLKWIHEIRKEKGIPISIMLDTKGPEIRVGKMKDGKQKIVAGNVITIYSNPDDFDKRECTAMELQMSYDMSKDVKVGDTVLVDDGKLNLTVIEVKKQVVKAKAFNTHEVKTNKRVNLPGVNFSLPFLAEKDHKDIIFGIENGIDYIAASFVNTAENVNEIRKILADNNAKHVQIISKIESQIGIDNIDKIIDASDGIMVARGDLGLEIPYYDVPYWEKIMIRKCREKGKIVIVATQMLESMTDNPAPTRAEVTDVYYAVELGADATMLSGESANGEYPFIATNTMSTIAKRAEIEFYHKLYYSTQLATVKKVSKNGERSIIAGKVADKVIDGDYEYAIIASRTGSLLKEVSKFRPNVRILGVCPEEKLWTAFGVWHSVFMTKIDDFDKFILDKKAINDVAKNHGAKPGEKILFVRNETIEDIIIK